MVSYREGGLQGKERIMQHSSLHVYVQDERLCGGGVVWLLAGEEQQSS